MKILKKLVVTLLILLPITTITLWILAKTINPEIVKNYVSSQLSLLTQQQSRVDGDITWQIFPQPGIKITKIQIGDESNQTPYSAQLENLLFNLKITPLLRGKLVFNDLNVDGFKIYVHPYALSQPVKTIKTTETPHGTKTNLAGEFAIERFLLSRGQVVIAQQHRTITLSGLQIGVEQFNLHQASFPFQLKTNLEVIAGKEKILKTHLNFKGSTSLSPALLSNPLATLQNTPLDGQLSIHNTRLKQFKITKISAYTRTKSGVLHLNPLTFHLYNGESVGALNYEFASKKLILNQTATNLDSSKLIHDCFDKTLFKGSLDFSIHAQANLQNSNWQDTFTGNGNLTIKDGVIEAINLDKIIDVTSEKINTLLKGQKTEKTGMDRILEFGQFANPEFFKGNTRFNLLGFEYLLQNGKLESNSLILQTDKLQLKGSGSLNLNDHGLDSHLLAKVILKNQEVDKIQQLLGGSFPILIKGTLSAPTVLPDLQKINPILSKMWLQEALTKPVEKIGETIKTII